MKRQVLTLVGVLSLLLAAGSAFAQTIKVRADVPFKFIINKETLPAGQYTIESFGSLDGRTLSIRSADMNAKAMVRANSVQSRQAAEETKLVFLHYGDLYFLSQIWVAGRVSGHQLPKSARETELARDSRPLETIVAALLK